MVRWRKAAAPLLLAGLVVWAGGCGGAGQTSVKGAVTLDDQPVGPGSISFLSTGEGGANAAAAIEDGKYQTPPDRGPRPGTYKVEISWPKKTGKKIPSLDPGIMSDETREAIPAKYNAQSTLTVEIQPGENVKDFHLKSR